MIRAERKQQNRDVTTAPDRFVFDVLMGTEFRKIMCASAFPIARRIQKKIICVYRRVNREGKSMVEIFLYTHGLYETRFQQQSDAF